MQQPNKRVGEYVLQKQLGEGAFGQVWSAIKTKNVGEPFIPIGKPVAIKCMNKEYLRKKNISSTTVVREIHVSMYFNHPRIVKFLEHIETENTHYMVFKLYPYRDLENYVKAERQGRSYLEPEATERLYDLKIGYEQIRARNIIHRDLKPANIFVDEKHQLVIGDLGFARFGHEFYNQLGTLEFMAPEILKATGVYSEMVDMWSLGMIFYWMLFQTYPWGIHKDKHTLLAAIQPANGKLLPLPNHNLTQPCVDLLQTMLTEDPNQRLKWDIFFKHPIFEPLKGKIVTDNQLPVEANMPEFRVGQTQYTTAYESERYEARTIFGFCKELRRASKLKDSLASIYRGFLICYALGTLKGMVILENANKRVQTITMPQVANAELELRKFIESGEHKRMVNLLDADCFFFKNLLEHASKVVAENQKDLMGKDAHSYASDFEMLQSESSIIEIDKALKSHLEWIIVRLNKPDLQGQLGLDSSTISDLRDLVIKNTAFIHLITTSKHFLNVRSTQDMQNLQVNLGNRSWLAEVARAAGVNLISLQ